ncbi:hypothetical protein ACVWY1_002451 [Pseudomonas sp. TE6288]|uniref:PIN-like domain-containing protein n=1 Tax=Pseudomonas hunanensis TaxID=1247546 RepID=UPI002404F60F|nr:PIN-like domain-containing protein [Pseudomonas hunanensis]MDF9756321.1 hypothetical protein [Pseudomonas hunanensis]
MRDTFAGWYGKDSVQIERIWNEGLFIPDTNVLLHCLRHPAKVRDRLLGVFEALSGSLWLPYQVGLEFHKNRLGVEYGAIDAYESLIRDQESIVEKSRDRFRQLRAHPTIDVDRELSALEMYISDFRGRMEAARDSHPKEEISKAVDRLTKVFEGKVGLRLSTEKLIAIKKEGEDRYAKKIPPGYKDEKKDCTGYDRFGDLIIWREIICKAKAENRSVVFITDDAKEDWWWIHRGRKIGPRPELIEEFKLEVGQDFHMYEFGQFLRFAAEHFPVINSNFDLVTKSLLADEQARLHQNASSNLFFHDQITILEDERDQLIGMISGTPGYINSTTADLAVLRSRLDELNKQISSLKSMSTHSSGDVLG